MNTPEQINAIAEKFLKSHRILQPDQEGMEEEERVILVRLILEATEPLRKENAELKRDKERLDWLQANGETGYWFEE